MRTYVTFSILNERHSLLSRSQTLKRPDSSGSDGVRFDKTSDVLLDGTMP